MITSAVTKPARAKPIDNFTWRPATGETPKKTALAFAVSPSKRIGAFCFSAVSPVKTAWLPPTEIPSNLSSIYLQLLRYLLLCQQLLHHHLRLKQGASYES
ncbi:MAG: hypothetical protein RIR78_844 [Actinomycetota bacterium]